MRGGARPGAGRKPNIPNKVTLVKAAEIAAEGLTPLQFMLSILRDTKKTDEERMDAAKAAAPYSHPKLANIDANITAKFDLGAMLDAISDS